MLGMELLNTHITSLIQRFETECTISGTNVFRLHHQFAGRNGAKACYENKSMLCKPKKLPTYELRQQATQSCRCDIMFVVWIVYAFFCLTDAERKDFPDYCTVSVCLLACTTPLTECLIFKYLIIIDWNICKIGRLFRAQVSVGPVCVVAPGN